MENVLVYPAIYKHFKNKYYATMGISNPINNEEEMETSNLDEGHLVAYHTELEKKVVLLKLKNKEIVHDAKYSKEILVLYKTLYDDTGIYVRPIDMFLSEVDKKKYPNTKQVFRFELQKI
ncbi:MULTISPECIES: DUF1653 domain-containing protein [Clostridium]|uniref:DUF1653 domain-containing protein n=2 Tax=Clostridium TaxID=1485 RepID=A0AAU8YTW4_CLOBO|nr:DUF1653 domain-containing protein [Clostridium sporogenes]AVP60498.1 DUF1653 domain-containing protein [Clostridium botulinum]AVP63901.1 DUF1653 domain-containing protein [Clostridium botulinum]EHN13375.1 hypothetical protein IYC_19940 [Clostridium sporogenes PA 3679]MBA4510054.1 DUF1653 domain-containing protein [Clostridium sporogenes]MBW5456999.1 DUF1653 domain-containing protein [Clostridium sporogenes]